MTDHQTDIEWLKKGFDKLDKKVDGIDEKLDQYLNSFETKEDARREHERLQKQLDQKADKEDVGNIQRNISWVVKIVIGAVIVSLLTLLGLNK